jgi:folate-binding protein YgfZ
MSNSNWILEPSEETQAAYRCLKNTCVLLELSDRGRLCLTGNDRISFLHGQITQDIQSLSYGQGAYAALVDAKGKIQSDLNVYILKDEILLDFEKGYAESIVQRLEHHLISEDVSIVDPSEFYTMSSVQGPMSTEVLKAVFPDIQLPESLWHFTELDGDDGSVYVCHRPRFGSQGFDLFIPQSSKETLQRQLESAVEKVDGSLVRESDCELARIEAGIPKMGIDMTSEQLVQETGLTPSVISFSKGCYIGQEVISRIRTVGKVNKSLLRLAFDAVPNLDSDSVHVLKVEGKDAGFVTSLAAVSGHDPKIHGLGYVKRPYLEGDASFTLGETETSKVKIEIIGEPSPTGFFSQNA